MSRSALGRVIAEIDRRWGGERSERQGMYFFSAGLEWETGPIVLFHERTGSDEDDDRAKRVCVELSGSALAALTPDAAIDFARWLRDELGARATRFDCAVDLVGYDPGLGERALASCRAGELCRCKTYEPYTTEGTGGIVKGFTLYMGLRGKNGSGRLVRLYDKGLKEHTSKPGEWWRYEVELTGQVAEKSFSLLLASEDWRRQAFGLAVEAVEFRQVKKGVTALARRELVEWYAALVESIRGLRQTATKAVPRLATFTRWAARCWLPTIKRMKDRSGESVERVLAMLVRDEDIAIPGKESGVVAEFLRFAKSPEFAT